MKIAILILLVLAGCATPEQKAARAALAAEAMRKQQEAIMQTVESTCAYAKSDQIKYGDCVRETVMFLYQQAQQQMMAQQQQQQANALLYQQIIQNQIYKPPVRTNCIPTFGGGMNCTTQ